MKTVKYVIFCILLSSHAEQFLAEKNRKVSQDDVPAASALGGTSTEVVVDMTGQVIPVMSVDELEAMVSTQDGGNGENDEGGNETAASISSSERENLNLIGRKAAIRALGSPYEPEKYPCKNTKIGKII